MSEKIWLYIEGIKFHFGFIFFYLHYKNKKMLNIHSLLEHGADANSIDPETEKSLLQIVIENWI